MEIININPKIESSSLISVSVAESCTCKTCAACAGCVACAIFPVIVGIFLAPAVSLALGLVLTQVNG